MLKQIILICALAGAGYVAYLKFSPQLTGPNRVGEQLNSLGDEVSGKDSPKINVISAEIVQETDNSLRIRYHLRNHADDIAVSACGDVSYASNSYPWGCQPLIIPAQALSIDITYLLASSARAIECSDSVSVHFYIGSGFSFYQHRFALEKIWHKEPGPMSWFNYRQSGCQ